jgi:hypothetical protein
MKNKDVEYILVTEAANAVVPDRLTAIKSEAAGVLPVTGASERVNPVAAKRGNFKRLAVWISAAAAALIIIGVLTPAIIVSGRVYSAVSIDILPSVELLLNANDTVVDVKTLNADGDRATAGLRLRNKPIEDAARALLAACKEAGYLTADGGDVILLSVSSADSDRASGLKLKLCAAAENYCADAGIGAAVRYSEVDAALKGRAAQCCVSIAKLQLVLEAYGVNDGGLNEEEFVADACCRSVTELYGYIESGSWAARK